MTTMTMHPLAADYLRDLEREARRLPRAERQELVEEIRAHLAEATDPMMTDAEALTVLDRLGQPHDIVKAERPEEEENRRDRRGIHEWAAIILLLLGGFAFGFGWIAGLILLWSSRAWNTRDKLIGTFVVPGGLAATWFVSVFALVSTGQSCDSTGGGPQHCTGGTSTVGGIALIALFAFLVLGPIFTSVYLARRAR
jgi:uncharacterized membrane protein